MNTTIYLNDELRLQTAEIDNVWADRVLAAKLQAVRPLTQQLPKKSLGKGHL